jgi:hypothetical protein
MRQKDEIQDETVREDQAGLPDQELAPNRGDEDDSSIELLKDEDLSAGGEETEEGAGLRRSRGFWIALATFVPTFVAIFFGIPYLAGLPMETRFPSGLKGSIPPVVSSLAPERGFVGAPPQEPAPRMPSAPSAMLPVGHAGGPSRSRLTAATRALGTAAPAVPRPASQSRPQVKPKAAEPKRSASTGTKDDSWLLAAAFADRDSAERLAASIERQGYPAKVRRHDATTTPWVVWVGKQPRGMTPSERK